MTKARDTIVEDAPLSELRRRAKTSDAHAIAELVTRLGTVTRAGYLSHPGPILRETNAVRLRIVDLYVGKRVRVELGHTSTSMVEEGRVIAGAYCPYGGTDSVLVIEPDPELNRRTRAYSLAIVRSITAIPERNPIGEALARGTERGTRA